VERIKNNIFSIHRWNFLFKVQEIKQLCGGVLRYAAQAIVKIDAEIGQKGHLGIGNYFMVSLKTRYENS
jgi:hypothetical protein